MKITKFLTFAMALGVLFTSCNKDEVDGNFPGGNEEKVPAVLSLYVTDAVSTRGIEQGNDVAGEAIESEINKIQILVYGEGLLPELYESYEVSADTPRLPSIYHLNVEVPAGTGSATKKVVVLVNNYSFLNSGDIPYAGLKGFIYDLDIASPTQVQAGKGIPMSGENQVTATVNSVTPVVVEVSRLYAKFNAPSDANASVELKEEAKEDLAELLSTTEGTEITKDAITNVTFGLEQYYVINGLRKSYMFPNYGGPETGSRWDIETWMIGGDISNYLGTSYRSDGRLLHAYSGANYLTNTPVYLYENSPAYTPGTGFDSRSVYAFIIEGKLNVTVNGLGEREFTRYWRINVSKSSEMGDYLKILRNSIYNVNIDTVKTIGEGTAKEAENPEPPIPGLEDAIIQVSVEVLPWRVFNEETDI